MTSMEKILKKHHVYIMSSICCKPFFLGHIFPSQKSKPVLGSYYYFSEETAQQCQYFKNNCQDWDLVEADSSKSIFSHHVVLCLLYIMLIVFILQFIQFEWVFQLCHCFHCCNMDQRSCKLPHP